MLTRTNVLLFPRLLLSNLKMPLPLRILGREGPHVPANGFDLRSLGGFYEPAGTLEEKVAPLKHAHTTGLRFWDIADVYADSEDVVGERIKRSGKRDDSFLATKFAPQHQPDGGYSFRSDPEYVNLLVRRASRDSGWILLIFITAIGWMASRLLKRQRKLW